MECNWRKLSVYVYNKEYINRVLLYIVETMNQLLFLEENISFSKKWQLGPHIEIVYPIKNEEEQQQITKAIQQIRNFLDGNSIDQDKSYEKHLVLSNKIAQLEGYEGEIRPLKKHLEVIDEMFNWNDVDTIFPIKTYKKIEFLLSDFFCHTYQYYFQLTKTEKDVFLSKCMIILGNQQEKEELYEGGIQYGYMTFQSHYYGFKSQLHPEKNSEMKILTELEQIDLSVISKLQEDMQGLVDKDPELKSYFHSDRNYFVRWKQIVNEMLVIYEDSISDDKVKWNQNHNMNTFFMKNGQNLSQFHVTLKENSKYMEFLNSKYFLKHRLTINAFYRILPLYGVSPLYKHKLCKYVSDSVEGYYSQDYQNVMHIINSTYRKNE